MKNPAIMVSSAIAFMPYINPYAAMVPDSAPVGPTMLKLLPPNIDATKPAQMAVIMPAVGDEFDATANDIDNGIETSATLSPAFQFSLRFFINMIFVPREEIPIYPTVGQNGEVCKNFFIDMRFYMSIIN